MTNSVNYPNQPLPANYSGVTIYITNPTVNTNPNGTTVSGGYIPSQCPTSGDGYISALSTQQTGYQTPQIYIPSQPASQQTIPQEYVKYSEINQTSDINRAVQTQMPAGTLNAASAAQQPYVYNQTWNTSPVSSYPPQYYMNNYTYNTLPQGNIPADRTEPQKDVQKNADNNTELDTKTVPEEDKLNKTGQNLNASGINEDNLNTSREIINNLDTISEEEKEIRKNSEQKKIVALTNEYIMSLENYLNDSNLDIRLMAAKEVLTRLDEDKNRYDDAALNALLNKMLQDPDDLIRIAALSAFNSELASGNNYTVTLLTKIQQNPEANKDDVLQASEILLKMTADTDTKYMPAQTSTVEIKTTKTEGE